MSTQVRVKRYFLIFEKVTSNLYPTLRDIKDFVIAQDIEVSTRTIQRDIENIRDEFKQEIEFDPKRKGYFLNKATSINTDQFLRLLEMFVTANTLIESLADRKNVLQHVFFDTPGNIKGVENLKPLLVAIKNRRKIFFRHENFETDAFTNYTINPYALKQFKHRWYIIGWVPILSEIRTFGIDRISDLEVRAANFRSETNPIPRFENVIGLTNSHSNPEEVELLYTPLQGKYAKTLPIHSSQQILNEDENGVTVHLFLCPNFEFKQEILMLGDAVKVIKPQCLVDEITECLKSALDQYISK